MADSWIGKPCPKCRHVRTASATVPDWQCPACGIAYAKFLQAQTGQATNPGMRTVAGAVPAAPVSSDGKTGLAMFAHLSIPIGMLVPFLSLIAPIVIWVTQSGKNDAAVGAAKESLNFQISLTLWAVLIVGIAFAGIWLLVIVLGSLVGLAALILPIVAAVKVADGQSYTYPFTWHLFS